MEFVHGQPLCRVFLFPIILEQHKKIRRIDKRQLMSFMGNLPSVKAEKLIAQAESRYGFIVPFVLEAP